MVRDLRSSILGQRCANVYDVDDKTYLFKFSLKDDDGEAEKVFLLVESGIRFHTTKFQRAKNEIPSPFAMKLRKYVRTRKIEDIKQLGLDRVVDIRFGSGDTAVHILLEFYANGNLILTDANYEVIALLRSHQFDAEVALKVGELYPLRHSTTLESTEEGVSVEDVGVQSSSVPRFLEWASKHDKENELWQTSSVAAGALKARRRGLKKMNIRQLLLCKDSPVAHFGPELIDHMILTAGLVPSVKVESLPQTGVAEVATLLTQLRGASALLTSLEQPLQPGYVILNDPAISASESVKEIPPLSMESAAKAAVDEYTEFTSFLFSQHQGKKHVSFPTFGEAVDQYYYRLEEAKIVKTQLAAEAAAMKKLQKVKNEAKNHVEKLEKTQDQMQRAAQLVLLHADDIDKCLLVLNSCVRSGMAWGDVEDMVALEARQGNPIAALIKRLRLDKGRVVLQLPVDQEEEGGDEDEDDFDEQEAEERGRKRDSDAPTIEVDVDLSLTAHANARTLFTHRKAASQKHQQTVESSTRAVAAVEQSTHKALEAQRVKQSLREARKVHWWEKFHWFLTSDGHLVLSGKDAQQNELLVKRYLRKGRDVYVHAEVHGAASCVIRAKDDAPGSSAGSQSGPPGSAASYVFSPSALQEAGQACVCRSHAWAAKQIASAYWVHAEQVSKSAPSGEYLTTGSFMIYGKKNFLPPMLLEMGFGVAFRLDDQSVARHKRWAAGRAARGGGEEDAESESYFSSLSRYGLCEGEGQLEGEGEGEGEGGILEDVVDGGVEGKGDSDSDCEEAEVIEEAVGDDDEAESSDIDEENDSESEGRDKPQIPPGKDVEKCQTKGDGKAQAKGKGKAGGRDPGKGDPGKGRPGTNRVKTLSKKKARRYAEQDEEDRRLSMLALGHRLPREGVDDGESESGTGGDGASSSNSKDTKARERRDKAGIGLVSGQGLWQRALETLPTAVRAAFDALLCGGKLGDTDVGADELSQLATFSESEGLEVLELFAGEDGVNFDKKGNKSAFLAGVMRRFAKERGSGAARPKSSKAATKSNAGLASSIDPDRAAIQSILEDEGILDEEEGRAADEPEKLSGLLLADDVLLYAVPVVGPYSALRDFKYRVKLTPGVMKKGKAVKTATDAWVRSKEGGERERGLIRGLTDPECVAQMLGDVRVSMPGLYGSGTAKAAKKKQRGQKAEKKA